MQYELKTVILNGPVSRKDVNTFTQPIMVITGIVGQTYEGFSNKDPLVVDFPATGLNADQIEALLYTAATAESARLYPNT